LWRSGRGGSLATKKRFDKRVVKTEKLGEGASLGEREGRELPRILTSTSGKCG